MALVIIINYYMRVMGIATSTPSTPERYSNITLLLADPEKLFPEEFDPQCPFDKPLLGNVPRESFVDAWSVKMV